MDKKIEQWKSLAELYLKENIRVFIKDYKDTYYSADIIIVGHKQILIQCFDEKHSGQKISLFWQEISYFNKYEKGDGE